MANPTAIITGAGSGIGRATALALARAGWSLLITGRDPRKLAATAEHGGDRMVLHAGDLTADGFAEQIVDAAMKRFGRIDALANIAGHVELVPLAKTTDATWQRTLDVNLTAPFRLTRAAWPVFERQKRGVVVNVSSMSSIDPFPGLGAYAAAKGGLNLLTLMTAREGESIGVKAVAIAPGAVETPMLRSLFSTDLLPASAAAPPEAIAQLIADCITGQRAFTSGEVIVP
jgi:NAD(P)-dependent dehydrogenase (short-subunit alcohol dehydrogenase family)